jgi:hypothetical protein
MNGAVPPLSHTPLCCAQGYPYLLHKKSIIIIIIITNSNTASKLPYAIMERFPVPIPASTLAVLNFVFVSSVPPWNYRDSVSEHDALAASFPVDLSLLLYG